MLLAIDVLGAFGVTRILGDANTCLVVCSDDSWRKLRTTKIRFETTKKDALTGSTEGRHVLSFG